MQNTKMQSLVDACTWNASDCDSEADTDRSILADWITDHPEAASAVIAALLRSAPEIIQQILQENLTLTVSHSAYHVKSGGTTLREVRLVVGWCGNRIAHVDIPVQ